MNRDFHDETAGRATRRLGGHVSGRQRMTGGGTIGGEARRRYGPHEACKPRCREASRWPLRPLIVAPLRLHAAGVPLSC